jgi:hypothetical protein
MSAQLKNKLAGVAAGRAGSFRAQILTGGKLRHWRHLSGGSGSSGSRGSRDQLRTPEAGKQKQKPKPAVH